MNTKCSYCFSKIDHFKFTQDDAVKRLSLKGKPNEKELGHALMRSVGGTCPKCGKVCCAKCYYDKKFICPHCGAKIPELGA